MANSVHFENISEHIGKHIQAADNDIVIAVAWFTDQFLFTILRQKASEGVAIHILYLDDAINSRAPFTMQQLKTHGAKIYPVAADAQAGNIMHNKFCVIDGKHVITGSYNWTKRAKHNDENIMVFTNDPETASHFLKQFDNLLEKYNFCQITKLNPQSIFPRLEVIKNFALMHEWDALPPQLEKLQPFIDTWDLSPLFTAVENKNNQTVATWVEDFIKRNTAIVIYEDSNIAELKIELRFLEHKVITLSAEKDEMQKTLVDFHQKSDIALGELTAQYLKLQAQLKQKKAEKQRQNHPDKDANEEELEEDIAEESQEALEEEAEEAWREYEEYQEGFEQLKDAEIPATLSDDDSKTLKKIYRKACQLCHPDKVGEADKDAAQKQFVALQNAYEKNDLEQVQSIHKDLIDNTPFVDNAETISDSDHLKREIARLQNTFEELLEEVIDLSATKSL